MSSDLSYTGVQFFAQAKNYEFYSLTNYQYIEEGTSGYNVDLLADSKLLPKIFYYNSPILGKILRALLRWKATDTTEMEFCHHD